MALKSVTNRNLLRHFSLFMGLLGLVRHQTMALSNKLALGAGCYWGTEKFIVKDFQKNFPGAIKYAKVGFMAPDPSNSYENPTYRQVCTGASGHVEVLFIELNDPPSKYFEPMMKFFFQFHDPTTKNRQGNDAGQQYASVIFCDDEEQKRIANGVIAELQKLVSDGKVKYINKVITTDVVSTSKFYEAQDDHQEYLEKNPSGYCNHMYRFKEWPQEL